MECRICGNTENNSLHLVREMMFGYRDIFQYFQCNHCLCLQIKEPPTDLSRYYPLSYYSYNLHTKKSIVGEIIKIRDIYDLTKENTIGSFFSKKYPNERMQILSRISITKENSILDVGCGNGKLLYALKEMGFNKLLGIDPFIDKDINYINGLTIKKEEIFHIEGKWNIIFFYHSLEHIFQQHQVMKKISEILDDNGVCIIAIPIVSSYAWEYYGVDWVQLDAPRHFYLHSSKSINHLINNYGLYVHDILYNSNSFQFWGSEQYRRDIPLNDTLSYKYNRKHSIFSKKDIKNFEKRSKHLNSIQQGDQAIYYIKKMNNS